MQQDEEIWQAIRHNHCSFMAKTTGGNFCRNPYNVTEERLKMGVYPRDIDYHPKLLVDDVVPDYEERKIEYVEGYDLEEEADIEDFEALAINGPDILDGDKAGVGEYDSEERRTTDHKRVRREYNLEPRKPEQEESSIKLKKPKVLMEVEQEDADGTQRAAAPLYFNSFSINGNQHISS